MFEDDHPVEQSDEDGVLFVSKEDLVGQTVVFQLQDYDEAYEGKHGDVERAIVDLYVATGDHRGVVQPGTWWFGNLAKQASQVGVGRTSVGIVETGKSARGGNWFGMSYDRVSPDAYAEALTAAKAASKNAVSAEAPF